MIRQESDIQTDSINCGYFVCYNIEKLILKLKKQKIDNIDVNSYRNMIK